MTYREPNKSIPVYDITTEDVLSSGLLPSGHIVQYIGNNWFKDAYTGTAYQFERQPDGTVNVKGTRESKLSRIQELRAKARKKTPPKEKFMTINCCECGAPREIHVQDAFQVKRCVLCQKKSRTKKMLARKKAKKEAERLAHDTGTQGNK